MHLAAERAAKECSNSREFPVEVTTPAQLGYNTHTANDGEKTIGERDKFRNRVSSSVIGKSVDF